MRISPRLPLLALAAFLVIGSTAFAQNVFTCSSNDMGRHVCRIGDNPGIQFLRQRSDAACVEGQTYGIGRHGVWVDRGCRADFQIVENGYNNGDRTYNRQGSWTGRRDRDDDDDDDNVQARRDRRRDDDSAYSNGQYTTPYNNRGYVNSGQPIQYMGRFDDGKSTCSSQPGVGPVFCQSGGPFRDAYLIKQNGQNQCVRGQNWDVDPDHGLWIADGCSGQFKIQK